MYAQARLEPKQHIAIINVTSFINEQGYSLIIDDVIELFFYAVLRCIIHVTHMSLMLIMLSHVFSTLAGKCAGRAAEPPQIGKTHRFGQLTTLASVMQLEVPKTTSTTY